MDMVGIHFEALRVGASITQREDTYLALEKALERHNVKITHYSLWSLDNHNSGKYKKYGGGWHKKRLEKGFSEIDGMGFCSNPKNSNSPAYDWTAKADFSWTVRTSLTLLLPKENCNLDGTEYRNTIQVFSELTDWDYGWGLLGNRHKGVAPYTSGDYDDGRLSKEDSERLDLWYVGAHSEKEKRLTHLRDVFHHNYITTTHLKFPMFGGTLKDFISKDKSSTISELSDGLWLWVVDVKSLAKVRKKIQSSGMLLSRREVDRKLSINNWVNKLKS